MTARQPASIRLDQIHFSARAWPREYLDTERVEDFAALYLEQGPSALPAPELIPDGRGGFLIGDGVHRIEAARLASLETLPCQVVTVPEGGDPVEFAFLYALRCSALSAKPLTRAEKQAAVRRLLEANPDASDREIGRLVGVDHKTVGRIRQGDYPRQNGGSWVAGPAPEAVAKRLFRAFEKAYETRGLGVADFFVGDRTGERLAAVLFEVYGEQALEKTEQFRGWLARAAKALEEAEG